MLMRYDIGVYKKIGNKDKKRWENMDVFMEILMNILMRYDIGVYKKKIRNKDKKKGGRTCVYLLRYDI